MEIINYFLEHGKTPKASYFHINKNNYSRNFGTWNNALLILGLPLIRKGNTPKISKVCARPECNNITENPRFCSSSCAAKLTNKEVIKRKKTSKLCIECGTYHYRRSKYCSEKCNTFDYIDWETKSISDLHNLRSYQISSRIRELARQVYRNSSNPKYCINCGYNKHYEVCHIKAIKDFDKSAKISEVNNLSNLVSLCRNCHWEFDAGFLKL
jgi:hypothetical protein